MAWHYGTHSCGHDGRVQIYGPTEHRDRKAEWWFSRPCDECLAKQRQAENVQNAEKAREMELPNLKGVSEKQIAYGETCRIKLIERIEKFIERWEKSPSHFNRFYRFPWEEVTAIVDRILQITSAKWWIENEKYSEVGSVFEDVYKRMLIDRKVEEKLHEKKQELDQEPKHESQPPLRPEDPKTETIAEIRIEGKKLQIRFPESRDDFRKVAKEKLRMSWKHGVWERKMEIFSGSIQDRAAEAAHHLLSEGFIVRLDDPQAREKAISGSYEPEHTRWVIRRTESGVEYFGIMWDRINEDYYSVVKRLPTAKWSNPYMLVRPEQFEEILDFAERYDFKLSPGAEELVQKAREAKDRALLLNVQKPEDPKRVVVSTEPPKLEVPEVVDIDESLRDED